MFAHLGNKWGRHSHLPDDDDDDDDDDVDGDVMTVNAQNTDWHLESVRLSEISQTEKDKYCMISLICGV